MYSATTFLGHRAGNDGTGSLNTSFGHMALEGIEG